MKYNNAEHNFLMYQRARKHPGMYELDNGEFKLKSNTSLTRLLDEDSQIPLATELRERDPGTLDQVAMASLRGYMKLFAGAASVPLAGLEIIDVVSEGTVEKIGTAFEDFLAEKLPEQSGTLPMLAEGIAQYMLPGLGYYKIFSGMTKLKGFNKFLEAALPNKKGQELAKWGATLFGTEFATTMTAQNPTDPNFVGFLVDVFGVDKETSELYQNEMIKAIAEPADKWDAESVLMEKLQAIPGDLAIAGSIDRVFPVIRGIVSIFRGIKREADGLQDIVNDTSELTMRTNNG